MNYFEKLKSINLDKITDEDLKNGIQELSKYDDAKAVPELKEQAKAYYDMAEEYYPEAVKGEEKKEEVKKEEPKKVVKKTKAVKTPQPKKETAPKVILDKKDADFTIGHKDKNTTLVSSNLNKNWVMTVEKKGDKFTVSCCDEDTKHPDDFKTQLQAISYSKEFLHCRYLFDQAKAKAKARRSKSSVKHAEELKTDVTATLEDTQDAIENKVEEKAKKGKEITKAEQKETVATIENIVATIQAGIKKDTDRKAFIKQLIAELSKLIDGDVMAKGVKVKK